MNEEWRAVPGFPRYEVSDQGRVRSLDYNKTKTVRVLKLWFDGKGYWQICLCGNRTKTKRGVHQIVLEAFVGPCPESFEGAHLNGVRTDNRLVNLIWCSKKENHSHKVLHGTTMRGSKSPNAKLTEKQVKEIRAAGDIHKDIAIRYGVHHGTVGDIKRRATWGWLE